MKRVDFYIEDRKIEFLKKLPGTLSEHLRRATDDYVEKKKNINVSSSSSKKGSDLHG